MLTATPDVVEDLAAYRLAGGYEALTEHAGHPAQALHDRLDAAPAVRALRGRGGAAYPFWAKVARVRASVAAGGCGGPSPEVVANGAEGEPLSVKDRYLMRHRPHLVLDGVALAAAAVGAGRVHLYVADSASREALAVAAEQAAAGGVALPALVVTGAQDTFVAGEASAVVRALDTGVARPRDSPERTSQTGVGGAPTLLSNVETFARVARALLPDPPLTDSPLLVTVSGAGVAPALVEVPYGLPAGQVVAAVTGSASTLPPFGGYSVLVGGFFGGVLPLTAQLALSVESMAAAGGGLGCVCLYVLRPQDDPVAAAATVADYYAGNNARQCRTCVESTRSVSAALHGLAGRPEVVLEQLGRWSTQLAGRGACAVPDGVALLLRSLLRHYPDRLADHLVSATPRPATAARSAAGGDAWAHLVVPVPRARTLQAVERGEGAGGSHEVPRPRHLRRGGARALLPRRLGLRAVLRGRRRRG